jgi:hypothetical protein
MRRTPAWIALTVAGFVLLGLNAAALGLTTLYGVPRTAVAVGVFLAQLLAFALIVVGFGAVVSKTLWGFALSSRNAYSLSKTQMAGWTVVVLGALFTAAELRIFHYLGVPKTRRSI